MKKGNTVIFENPPVITCHAAVGGKRESEGPLSDKFDMLLTDTKCSQPTWEKAESVFQRYCMEQLLQKSNTQLSEIDCVLSGDLQCQCTASSYAMRGFEVPHLGLYGACSTMAQGMAIGSMLLQSGMQKIIAMASSHFCAAERQFRTPLDYGGKRAPTAQWTVTGAGGVVIEREAAQGVKILSATLGQVIDYDVKDINNMGAAMAPAAAHTLLQFFKATGKRPLDYDKVFTGDLGFVGSALLKQLLSAEGINLCNHADCGLLVFDRESQNVEAGGSGAGCSACVLSCEILPSLKRGTMKNVLFMSTGALMSQTTSLQGESIPCIAHLTELASQEEKQ